MVELYKRHYVGTSVSPLKQQENDTNITEVYVAPKMVVEEKQDSNTLKPIDTAPNKNNTKTVNRYKEILQTNGQKHTNVFIVGDVGTGKITFCKMMIQNWCSAVSKDGHMLASNDKLKDPCTSATDDNDQNRAVEVDNINDMRNFDFLFFVSLQRMSGLTDITAMIKAIATEAGLASNDLVDRIFQQESERCLIVADGLDEWTPPPRKSIFPHVSYGLPERDKAKQATDVTLSRPSAKGILNMKSSECDQKVELLGIDGELVECFIKNYLSKVNTTDRSSDDFLEKMKLAELDHLEETPLLLQQLVWLYSIENEIGKSVSVVYSHLVNIMLGWSQNKEKGEESDRDKDIQLPDRDKDIQLPDRDKDIQLPILLQRFPRCEANKKFLFLLAKVAFEALTSETVPITFSRSYLQQRTSNAFIATLVKLGILVENNCFDPTQENTFLKFIHISYLEFFAAVYVSSHYTGNECSMSPGTTLQGIFQEKKSCADVLQLSNVLKMICGLSPFLISELSKLISDIVKKDESVISWRKCPIVIFTSDNILTQIQRLMFNCLSECDSGDQPMVSICDVILTIDEKPNLNRIIPENVISLNVFGASDIEVWRWITQLKQVQYVHINLCILKQREMELFSSFIQNAPLRYLTLCVLAGKSHTIDLSKHDQLQVLSIVHASVTIPQVNTTQLESLCLDAFTFNTLDTNCLTGARCLTELTLHSNPYNRFLENTDISIQYNKTVDSLVHTLQQLRNLTLTGVEICDNDITVTPEMKNLINIDLRCVRMSLGTWRRFVHSLLTLQQSIQVDYTDHSSLRGGEQYYEYVKRNEKFEVIKTKCMCELLGDMQTFTLRTRE